MITLGVCKKKGKKGKQREAKGKGRKRI